eukprot:7437700-Prorocentrum_lima.AAC.1
MPRWFGPVLPLRAGRARWSGFRLRAAMPRHLDDSMVILVGPRASLDRALTSVLPLWALRFPDFRAHMHSRLRGG